MTSHTSVSRNNHIKRLTKFSVVAVHTFQNFRKRVNATNTYKYRYAESKNMDSESFASASYYIYLWTTANNQQFLHAHICPDLHYTSRFKIRCAYPEMHHHIQNMNCLALKCAIRLTSPKMSHQYSKHELSSPELRHHIEDKRLASPEVRHQIDDTDFLALKCDITLKYITEISTRVLNTRYRNTVLSTYLIICQTHLSRRSFPCPSPASSSPLSPPSGVADLVPSIDAAEAPVVVFLLLASNNPRNFAAYPRLAVIDWQS